MDDVNKTIPHLGALRGGKLPGVPPFGGTRRGDGDPAPEGGVLTHTGALFSFWDSE